MLKNESFQIHVKFCVCNKKSVRNSLNIFSEVHILTKSSCGAVISEKRAIPDYVLLRPSYVLLRSRVQTSESSISVEGFRNSKFFF